MKKISLIILLFLISLPMMSTSTSDSIRRFLTGIGEVEPYISIAANTKKPFTFKDVYDVYCRGQRITSIKGECQLSDYKVNHRYVMDCIVNDTMLGLLGHMTQGHNFVEDDCDSLISCYSYAVNHFNSIEAAHLLENIYYQRVRQKGHSLENEMPFFFSAMIACALGYPYGIIFQESYVYIPTDSILLAEENLSNEEFQKLFFVDRQRYYQYLPEVFSYKILSPLEQQELDSLLTTGAKSGSHFCKVMLAFALITGVPLPKDLERGRDILVDVWPQMKDSPFWNYVERIENYNTPKI